MESITAIVAAGVAFALSYYIGRSMASTTLVAAMMGGACRSDPRPDSHPSIDTTRAVIAR